MLRNPSRQRYLWIYDPEHLSLVMLPNLIDMDVYAKNLLKRILKSLKLTEWLQFLQGDASNLKVFECIADKDEFSLIIAKLNPRLILYFGDLQFDISHIHQLPHPNTWHQHLTLKKRIWLSWHELKYKVG